MTLSMQPTMILRFDRMWSCLGPQRYDPSAVTHPEVRAINDSLVAAQWDRRPCCPCAL